MQQITTKTLELQTHTAADTIELVWNVRLNIHTIHSVYKSVLTNTLAFQYVNHISSLTLICNKVTGHLFPPECVLFPFTAHCTHKIHTVKAELAWYRHFQRVETKPCHYLWSATVQCPYLNLEICVRAFICVCERFLCYHSRSQHLAPHTYVKMTGMLLI